MKCFIQWDSLLSIIQMWHLNFPSSVTSVASYDPNICIWEQAPVKVWWHENKHNISPSSSWDFPTVQCRIIPLFHLSLLLYFSFLFSNFLPSIISLSLKCHLLNTRNVQHVCESRPINVQQLEKQKTTQDLHSNKQLTVSEHVEEKQTLSYWTCHHQKKGWTCLDFLFVIKEQMKTIMTQQRLQLRTKSTWWSIQTRLLS